MDRFSQRFDAFQRIPAPDLWPEIVRRAGDGTVAPVEGQSTSLRAANRRLSATPAMMVVLVTGLAATLALGGLIAGALLNGNGTPFSSASASAECEQVQTAARSSIDGWEATGPSAPLNALESGWIAAWDAAAEPGLVFVDPSSGQVCEVLRFEGYDSGAGRERGALSWSPDGSALAVVVVDAEQPRQDLYVWSRDGVAGPLVSTNGTLVVPQWASDGSWLAVTDSLPRPTSIEPRGESAVRIIDSAGSTRTIQVRCPGCTAGPAFVSPEGTQLALAFTGMYDNEGGSWRGMAAGSADDPVMSPMPYSSVLIEGMELVGWASEEQVLLRRNDDHTLVGMTLDDHSQLEYGLGNVPDGAWAHVPGLSPDGRVVAIIDENIDGTPELRLVDTTRRQLIATGTAPAAGPAWWSPDGAVVAYAAVGPGDDQGIWTMGRDGANEVQLTDAELTLAIDNGNLWQPRRSGE